MSKATVIHWRDIPTQVVVGTGRKAVKRMLSERFQVAVDKAAMAGGAASENAYLEDWRRVPTEAAQTDPEAAAEALADEIEREYSTERLAELTRHGGREHLEQDRS